jgi:hypothetical protein
MKNDLIRKFGEDKITHQGYWSDELHIVDYTERTKSKRAVEVHCIKPTDIDSLKIANSTKLHITTSIFKPQWFIGDDGKEPKQCECVLYPTTYTKNTWILFLEIKDCKPKNVSKFYQEIKDKVLVHVNLFRDQGIIEPNKVVYAVASFPRRNKTSFHDLFITPPEVKNFRDKHKIIIKGTNEITIKNDYAI